MCWQHPDYKTACSRLLVGFILVSMIFAQPAFATQSGDDLSSELDGLNDAENKSQYAAAHGLEFKNGSVRVVIELAQNTTLPDGYDVQIESQYQGQGKNLVQGYVPIKQLQDLANETAVTRIRPPKGSAPDTEQADKAKTTTNDPITRATSTANSGIAADLPLGSVIVVVAIVLGITIAYKTK